MITGGSSVHPCCWVNGCHRNWRSSAASSTVFTAASVDLGAVGTGVAGRRLSGREVGHDLAHATRSVIIGEVVGDARDQALDRLVLREDGGREPLHADLDRARGEQVGQVSAEALALEGVAD